MNSFQNGNAMALSQPPDLPTPAGFRPRSRLPVTTPAFLVPDSYTVTSITREPDSWDVQNQQKMLQIENMQHSGADLETLYRQLQAMREVERREMENRGLVDQQDTRKDLKDAIVFVGTCQDKCPTFERVRRAFEKDTKPFEKVLTSHYYSRMLTFIRMITESFLENFQSKHFHVLQQDNRHHCHQTFDRHMF